MLFKFLKKLYYIRFETIIYKILFILIKFLFIIVFYLFIGFIDFEFINNLFNVYALSDDNIEAENNENKEINNEEDKKRFYFFCFVLSILTLGFIYVMYKTSSVSDLPIIDENQSNLINEKIPTIEKNIPTDDNVNNQDAINALNNLINNMISPEVLNEINESVQNNKDGIQDKIKELLDQINKDKTK